MDSMTTMTGSRHLARALRSYGVDHVFYVPAVLLKTMLEFEDGSVRRIMTHGEKAAAYMADGYARASGKPGICFAQNVGGSNLAAGLRDGYMAGTPMIAITGGPSPSSRYRNYYQEIEDFTQFDNVTKFNASVDHVSRLPDLLRQAFRVATSGAPGPVHLRLAGVTGDDFMDTPADLPVIVDDRFTRAPAFRPAPDMNQLKRAAALLAAARRPIIIAGGGVATSGAQDEVVRLAELLQIPVATSLNAKGTIRDDHPLAVGVVGTYSRTCANRTVSEADLVFYIGSHTGGQVTTRWKVPSLSTQVIHLDIDPSKLGMNYPRTHAVLGDAKTGLLDLIDILQGTKPKPRPEWLARAASLIEAWRDDEAQALNSTAIPIRPERLCKAITRVLPENATLVSDTGHSGMWSGVLIDFLRPGQRYIRCAGSLGWALPAAIGVKCATPNRPVICFAGDGAAYYHIAELETAARYGQKVVFVINNNSALNQEIQLYRETYPGKPANHSDELWRFRDVNLSEISKLMGCGAIRIKDPADLDDALNEALRADGPAVVEVLTDINAEAKNAWRP